MIYFKITQLQDLGFNFVILFICRNVWVFWVFLPFHLLSFPLCPLTYGLCVSTGNI